MKYQNTMPTPARMAKKMLCPKESVVRDLPDVPRHANDDVPPTANIHTGLAREFGISRETLYRYLKTKS